jgi:carboxypeptidase PM20D1
MDIIPEREMMQPARRLAGAVQYRTVSHEDPAQIDYRPFFDLHKYLERSFPHVHSTLEREVVGDCSLLYRWVGRDPDLDPVLLMGHMDVVPVEADTEKNWTHPPFEGCIDGGYIWGRGTLDNKFAVTGLLEAVEGLLQDGFQPGRSLYLAFGQDEEVGGQRGAAQIVALLQSRGVKLEYVLDEGLVITDGIVPYLSKPAALIGIAEKGCLSLELSVETKGGHSSMPPRHTAAGVLSKAISRLEAHPVPPRSDSPAFQTFNRLAAEFPLLIRASLKTRRLTAGLLLRLLAMSSSTNANVRTTTAVTILQAGVKENILPTKARAVVNFRILPGDSRASVTGYVRKVIADSRVKITEIGNMGTEPSPVSSLDSPGYRFVEDTIRKVFPGVLVAPSLVLGITDCRYYSALSNNCYRFSPLWTQTEDLARPHGVNERISVKNYIQAIQFFRVLIQSSCAGT